MELCDNLATNTAVPGFLCHPDEMTRRYFGTFFLFLCLPFPLTLIPYLGNSLEEHYGDLWFDFFHALNGRLWHASVRGERTGSGDALDNYFTVAALALLAIPVALTWTNFAKHRVWVDSIIRWYLAYMLFSYGFTKFGQFPPPHPLRLYEPIGQVSPMGLLWTFMGASRVYTFFAGLMEVSAGVLLLIPRLQTLGAALALGVMGNVFLLNMCYDVPVKLFSFQLVLFAFWTLATDGHRVWCFVRGQSVPEIRIAVARHWRKAQVVVAILMVVIVVTNYFKFKEMTTVIAYEGTWAIESPGTWQRLLFYRQAILMLQNRAGGLDRFRATAKEPVGTYEVQFNVDQPSSVNFTRIDGTHLRLTGQIKGEKVDLNLTREPEVVFPLMSRGFPLDQRNPVQQLKGSSSILTTNLA